MSAPVTDSRPCAVFLMGPTASGKTALALRLVERYPVGIISVDSALVYRGMDIGTAKPDAAMQAAAPHRLIDLIDPEEGYSAAQFRTDALGEMQQLKQQGRIPLLVGGTGLYFRALERGLSELPEADPAIRADLEARLRDHGGASLHAELARLDPQSAGRIHPNDPQRVTRALEVIALTGRPLSELQGGVRDRLGWRLLKLIVAPTRERLHQRAAERFATMLDAGLLDEVRRLRQRPDLTAGHASMRAVGYRQSWQHLDGELSREQLIAAGVAATRQLAKRQTTWLRSEFDAFWIDPEDAQSDTRVSHLLDAFLA